MTKADALPPLEITPRASGRHGCARTHHVIASGAKQSTLPVPKDGLLRFARNDGRSLPHAMRAQPNFLNWINAILPAQSACENISLWRAPKAASIQFLNFRILLDREVESGIEANHPASSEGRFAIVTDVGAGCGGRGSVKRRMMLNPPSLELRRNGTKTVGWLFRNVVRGRRRRVVLVPRRWHQVGGSNSADDGGKRARSPGRARSKP
jgi:hypothetical protein